MKKFAKNIVITLLLVIFLCTLSGNAVIGQNDEYSSHITTQDTQLLLTPPPYPIRQPAEFEPMQGVLIRYPFGISYQIIAEMSEDVEVVTVVASSSQQSYVETQYQSNGVNLDHCSFLIAPSDSYWTRDYGPWFIFNGNDEQGIADFTYNRPRPNDNMIPSTYAASQGLPVYLMSLEHTGGNYMTDGQGISISTDLIWTENSGMTPQEIDQVMQDYCGIDTYHVVPDVNGDYIEHIDCWAKYLSPDTILIREVPSTHSQYDEIEDAVSYFESQLSCYGTPYNIVRVYTPSNEPYTNSLILNDKVLVPVTGSQWDDEALSSYQNAMPGYEILGFTGSWQSTDALHCRTKGIVDRHMLYIEHTPLTSQEYNPDGYQIQARIISYSEEDIISDGTRLYWKVENGNWNYELLQSVGNDYYEATIPNQGTNLTITYYLQAKDNSNREEFHPYIGEEGAHTFTIFGGNPNNPPEKPNKPEGPTSGQPGSTYLYKTHTIDLNGDVIFYMWDWGDGTYSQWLGPYNSGEICMTYNSWDVKGTYSIQVKAKDNFDAESEWSDPLEISMPRVKLSSSYTLNLLDFFYPMIYNH
jgi:agmatine/peptidylarginine deiminase